MDYGRMPLFCQWHFTGMPLAGQWHFTVIHPPLLSEKLAGLRAASTQDCRRLRQACETAAKRLRQACRSYIAAHSQAAAGLPQGCRSLRMDFGLRQACRRLRCGCDLRQA